MRIVVAPDKFRHSLTATEAADAIAAGITAVEPLAEIDRCPMADGGEGTVAALVAARGGRLMSARVTGPLPEMKVDAEFGLLDDGTAVVEMAAASGLALLPPADRDPLNSTTFGTGELLVAAVRAGARRIILGIGGSATNDSGVGCAQACGFTVLMRDGEPTSLCEPLCGRDVENVLSVKHGRGELTAGVEIVVASDVTAPLCGPSGAAAVFGPQKGATPAAVARLDAALEGLVRRMHLESEAEMPGAGAAGGLGFGMLAFFRATLRPGFDLIAQTVGLRQRLAGADLCFTGEGKIDAQSAAGKTVSGVGRCCKAAGVPCIALAGAVGDGADAVLGAGITAYASICDRPMSSESAFAKASPMLREAAANSFRMFRAKRARESWSPRDE
jgi:glycerate kinase